LRCNFVVAEGRGGSPSRPISGAKHRAPTIEAIVPVAFYEIINMICGPVLKKKGRAL
jgi:hypothetical protein